MDNIILSVEEARAYIEKLHNEYIDLIKSEQEMNILARENRIEQRDVVGYVLSDHRDTLNRCAANKCIIREQLDFLIEIAERYVSENQHELALSLLLPNQFDGKPDACLSAFDDFDLQEYYFGRIKNIKMLQTVNEEYISIQDNPLIIDDVFPECFIGDRFSSLLKSFSNRRHEYFIEFLCKKYNIDTFISENSLLDKINAITDSLSVFQRVEVFAWWSKNANRKSLPKLLKNQEEKWIEFGTECYFLTGSFDDIMIPSWVKIPALDLKYQNQLFELSEKNSAIINARARESEKDTHISRLICQKNLYPTIKFNYRDRNSIIPSVNASINGVYERAVEFVKWLWKNYGKIEGWTPPKETTFHFPCIEGTVANSEMLFLGEEYGNELAKRLFCDEYSGLVSIEEIGIDRNQMDGFVRFISRFGVKKFPETEIIDVVLNGQYKKELEREIISWGTIGNSDSLFGTFVAIRLHTNLL